MNRDALDPSLHDALAGGATVVTPNKRLARALADRYDAGARAEGRLTWPTPTVLPFGPWLGTLWLDALAADALEVPPRLIGTQASAHLWEQVVVDAAADLLDARGAAAHAAEAWDIFHAWRRPDDRFDGWSRAGIGDDAAAFARWAARYRGELQRRGAIDTPQLPEILADAAPRVPAWRGRRIVLAGFAMQTPQQQRLVAALAATGADVTNWTPPSRPASRRMRVACTTPADELGLALAWARKQALADPNTTIGLAIEDLATRRDEVVGRADDILSPDLAARCAPDAPRPWSISLGTPLSAMPIVAAALDLVALGGAPLAVGRAAALLRTPYLPGAGAQAAARALQEGHWIERGATAISLSDFVAAVASSDAALASRWRVATPLPRGARTATQWVAAWRAWLDALGWPGEVTLGGAEWQAREAWSRLLAEFAALTSIAAPMGREDAVAALRSHTGRTMFQPEGGPARVQILGVLEASGMTFDALWIAGLTADRWPPAPQPNPLLPLGWQRDRDVPRSHPARELAWARTLTAGFAEAADLVVASHARDADGYEREGSLLIDWPLCPPESLPQPAGRARALAQCGVALETADDGTGPPLADGAHARGGVAVIEDQSACPFKAFALHRLDAEPWPEVSAGLNARERGSLLHEALKELWVRLKDQATLAAQDDAALAAAIDAAVAAARACIEDRRWRTLPPAVAAGEARRLAATLRAWIDAVERARPPFTVRATEAKATLALGGLLLRLRLDRVDDLDDGGIAIVDYKSGGVVPPARWFAERPQGTQIGLYALAHAADGAAPPVRALAYGQVKAGDVRVEGLAADGQAWPALRTVDTLHHAPVANWDEAGTWWRDRLGALATAFRQGAAAVDPRGADCCRYCGLQTLCRIHSLDDRPRAPVADEDAT